MSIELEHLTKRYDGTAVVDDVSLAIATGELFVLLGPSGSGRAMGELGAVSVVSGHIRGLTNTLPLHVEILYNEYQFSAAFAVASLLTLLALVTLVLKAIVERRGGEAR
jgi:ABC-type sulfate transport system permease subunit